MSTYGASSALPKAFIMKKQKKLGNESSAVWCLAASWNDGGNGRGVSGRKWLHTWGAPSISLGSV